MANGDDQVQRSGTQAAGSQRLVPEANHYVVRDLAAGFAHELNQPLAAIAAYADGAANLLRRDPGHSVQALNIIQAIAGQALRAGAVVQQLRSVAGGPLRSTTTVDPNALIRTVQPLLESLAAQQEVRLLVELRTPAPAVIADADRLQALLVLTFGGALDTVARLPPARRRIILSTDEGAGCTVEVSGAEPQGMLFQVHLPRVNS